MSQQINLFDPALLRKRELLTLANIVAGSAALIVLLVVWGGVARSGLSVLEQENNVFSPQVKALQLQKDMLNAQLSAMKPDEQLEKELAKAREDLDLRTRQVNELKKGVDKDSGGFAEYLRGFARQTPPGLWLTGFAIADDGAAMEIRGRMMDPALLPEYIRRLNTERAFQGREFSALKVAAGKLDEPAAAPATPAATTPQSASSPTPIPAAQAPAAPAAAPFYEFSLAPILVGNAPAVSQAPGGKQ